MIIFLEMLWDYIKYLLGVLVSFLFITWIVGIVMLMPITIWITEENVPVIIKVIVTLSYIIPAVYYIIIEYNDRLFKKKNSLGDNNE